MLPTILIAESFAFSNKAADYLRRSGRVVLADLHREELLSRAGGADIIWVRLRHQIDCEVMDAAPHLQAIATPTTGLNHIDVAEARRRNIEVISLRGASHFLRNVYATAEHTMALILALLRHLPAAHQHVVQGSWNRDLFVGRELHGTTAGVIGYGRVGRMVARYLRAFGARVLVTDSQETQGRARTLSVTLGELLEQSAIVSLHISLSDKTYKFFGSNEFARMRPRSLFINTARGELIDEQALVDVLAGGQLAGAGLDVLTDESAAGMGANPLVKYARDHANLLLTPHIGGCTTESREKTEQFLAAKVVQFIKRHDLVTTRQTMSEALKVSHL